MTEAAFAENIRPGGQVLCKGAERDRSHAQGLVPEHGEDPALAEVLSVWLFLS